MFQSNSAMVVNCEIGKYMDGSMSSADCCACVDAAGAVGGRHGTCGFGGLRRDGAAVRACT